MPCQTLWTLWSRSLTISVTSPKCCLADQPFGGHVFPRNDPFPILHCAQVSMYRFRSFFMLQVLRLCDATFLFFSPISDGCIQVCVVAA